MTEQILANYFILGFGIGGIIGGAVVAGMLVWYEAKRRGNHYDW